MDGRLHLPIMTQVPLGIIQPFRNLGGHFKLGWHPFQKDLYEVLDYSYREGRDCLVLVTYHYSKSDKSLGCKGFGYDTEAAKSAALKLSETLRRTSRESVVPLYAVVVGIETDSDTLILHGYDGKALSMLDCLDWSGEELFGALEKLYPGMSRRVIRDFLPLLIGNIKHTAELTRKPRGLLDVYHKERVLAIGRGFDWLHMPNFALIIGPFSYDLRTPVLRAGEILLDNLLSGRLPNHDVVLITSALYRKNRLGVEAPWAAEKAKDLADECLEIIRRELPELAKHLSVLVGTTDMETRLFNNLSAK